MKKCCFINPYFGSFPNYFDLFLKTCAYNKSFNWLIITDCDYDGELPDNVKLEKMTFEFFCKKIQSKFDFKIALNTPYKLCDFKPAYGYIFEKEIEEYEYWGHCDLDILLGDLSKFLTDDLLAKYDKLFCLGHMVIYRNSYENNRIFMSNIDGMEWYKESFANSQVTIFDETYNNDTNINEIFLRLNKKIFQEDLSINFKVLPTNFIKTTYNWKNKKFDEDAKESLYIWSDGKLFRYFLCNNTLIKEEYLYIHLQERKMNFSKEILNNSKFKIVPNSFKKLEVDEISVENFKKITKKALNYHYIHFKVKWQKRKIQRILKKVKNCWSKNI